jgi:hypothetical protein
MSDTAAPSYQVQPVSGRGTGMAIASLILGILAVLSCFTVIGGVVLGVLAIIFGVIVVRRVGRGEASGKGMAIAGIVTGAVGVLLAIVLIAVGVSVFNSKSVQDLRSCLKDANGNQQAVNQCNQKYQEQVRNN